MELWSVLAVGQEVLRPEEAACLKVDDVVPGCHSGAALSTAMDRATRHSPDITYDRQTTDSPSAIHSKATHQIVLSMEMEAVVADVS